MDIYQISFIGEFFQSYTLIQIAAGILVTAYMFYRPRALWSIVIIGSILGQGPRFSGYQLYDEFIVWCAIMAAFARIAIRGVRLSRTVVETEQRAFFYLWVLYMVVESVIGIFINDDMRIVRWVLFYISIGLLAFVTYNYRDEFPFPPFRKLIQEIVVWGTIYNAAYLGIGLFYKAILGQSGHFDSQFLETGVVWAGTATAVYPAILIVPAAIMIIHERSKLWETTVSWAALASTMYVGHFYDSRMSFIVVVGCFVVSLAKINIKFILVIAAIFCVTFAVFSDPEDDNLQRGYSFFSKLYEGAATLFFKNDERKADGFDKGDVNRRLQFEAALLRVTESPLIFLFGDGIYSHRKTIIPHVEELYAMYLPDTDRQRPPGWEDAQAGRFHTDNRGSFDVFRTTGFSALLIDGGVVGMVLFVMGYCYVGLIIWKRRGRYRMMLLMLLVLNYWWLFVNNVVDVFIIYLLVMPGGMLENWSRQTQDVLATSVENEKSLVPQLI